MKRAEAASAARGVGPAWPSPGRLIALVTWLIGMALASYVIIAGLPVGMTPRLLILAPPMLLILAGALGWWVGPAIRFNVLFCAIALTLAAYGAEHMLGGADTRARRAYAQAHGFDFDPRGLGEVVNDLRKSGRAAYPYTMPASFLDEAANGERHSRIRVDGREVLPLSPVSRAHVVLTRERGPWGGFLADRHGFNNDDRMWSQPMLGLVAVGDSHTIGEGLEPRANLVTPLAAAYGPVLNLGMGGTGPLSHLAVLAEYLPRVRARQVLWVYFEGNDPGDLQREWNAPILRAYLKDGSGQNLAAIQPATDAAMREEIDRRLPAIGNPGAERGWRIDLFMPSLTGLLWLKRREPEPALDIDRMRQVLARAKDLVAERGAMFTLAYLPAVERFVAPDTTKTLDGDRAALRALCTELGIGFIDVASGFAATPAPLDLWPPPPAHYSLEGYRKAADIIAAGLPRP